MLEPRYFLSSFPVVIMPLANMNSNIKRMIINSELRTWRPWHHCNKIIVLSLYSVSSGIQIISHLDRNNASH